MTDIASFPITGWGQRPSQDEQERAILALEGGAVVLLSQLGFPLRDGEERLLSPAMVGKSKNVSLDPARDELRGGAATDEDRRLLHGMMMRFATSSRALLRSLFPRYDAAVHQARTSFRPVEIAGRQTSWRKDDTRLHVDAFPSSPTQGTRILRIFTNINPDGRHREWRLGEPFGDAARRHLQGVPRPAWGSSQILRWLRITKAKRSAYDHFMLQLHDRMKADTAYQAQVAQIHHDFAPGSTWIVFTDQVSHAAMSGQHALEQTFHLPVSAMRDPERSPLRVLERMMGRTLV
ncbi:MAG TPA: Kdo hydroxylase family protein [Burkholderiales bacterium]|nr:Kdo hydroxylase family protein [Burkholderiales bacterium]